MYMYMLHVVTLVKYFTYLLIDCHCLYERYTLSHLHDHLALQLWISKLGEIREKTKAVRITILVHDMPTGPILPTKYHQRISKGFGIIK